MSQKHNQNYRGECILVKFIKINLESVIQAQNIGNCKRKLFSIQWIHAMKFVYKI